MLESKEKVKVLQKEEIERLNRIREDYRNFLETEGGQDYSRFLTGLTEQYFRGAMNEVDRDKKATLVDTSSGIMKSLNYLTEMGKPNSAKRAQKQKKTPSNISPASQS